MADEAKLHSPMCSAVKCWLCDMLLGIVMEKNWALSVSQCWLQVLQFSVHLIHFAEHTSLRCNGFARIRKAVMDQLGSRPPDSDDDSFWV